MDQSETTAANLDRRSRRRWFQFSIRMLLVVVTLLCVALSMWVVPAERQRRAVEAFEKLGGHVFYVGEQTASDSIPKSLLTLRRWLPRVYFNEVIEVHLIHCIEVTDDDLVHLRELTGLQELWLPNTSVTDAGLDHLQGLTGLQYLHLGGTQITDAGAAELRKALPNCEIVGP